MTTVDDLDLNSRLLDFVTGVTEAMGLDLEARVEDTPDGPRVNIMGEDASVLLRHKGEALNALQHLTSTMFRDELPEHRRVVVDCMDFRRDKDVELRQMALFLGEKARRTGADQQLGPLNAYERRIVHMALSEDPDVETYSVGQGADRRVTLARRGSRPPASD